MNNLSFTKKPLMKVALITLPNLAVITKGSFDPLSDFTLDFWGGIKNYLSVIKEVMVF